MSYFIRKHFLPVLVGRIEALHDVVAFATSVVPNHVGVSIWDVEAEVGVNLRAKDDQIAHQMMLLQLLHVIFFAGIINRLLDCLSGIDANVEHPGLLRVGQRVSILSNNTVSSIIDPIAQVKFHPRQRSTSRL